MFLPWLMSFSFAPASSSTFTCVCSCFSLLGHSHAMGPGSKHICFDFHELPSPSDCANIALSLLVAPASCRCFFHPAGGWYAFNILSTALGLYEYVLVPVTKFSFMLCLSSLYFSPYALLSMRTARNFSQAVFLLSFSCSVVVLLMSIPLDSSYLLSMFGKRVIEPGLMYSLITLSIAMKSLW